MTRCCPAPRCKDELPFRNSFRGCEYTFRAARKVHSFQPRSIFTSPRNPYSHAPEYALWKLELQKLADETGLEISICHLPPGTSKWNKIEHRLFSFISQNWRGKPLVSHQVIVNLIAATTTKTGLRVRAEVDPGKYPKGVKISDKQVATIRLERDPFHGEWNYTILPRPV